MTSTRRSRSTFTHAAARTSAAAVFALLGLACLHGGDRPAPRAAVAPSATASMAPAATAADARTAVQRALPFLQKDGAWWMAGGKGVPGGGGCVSCHQVPFGLWSHREAQRAAVPFDRTAIDDLEKRARAFYDTRSKSEPFARGHLLLARELPSGSKDGTDARWTAMQKKLVEDQDEDGYWDAAGQFTSQKRPIEESDAVTTMWILIAFGSFQQPDPAVRAARDRAFAWIKKSPAGVSNEWLAARLLVERQLGDRRIAQGFQDRLLREQHADGGWSWLAKDPSNAFSTGETLYALATAGLNNDHPAVRRGVGYLLSTQNADGTWTTPSRLTSDKGEEGGKIEYIYKYWGTAWATIGLARTLSAAAIAAR
jgi:hypothetical protein